MKELENDHNQKLLNKNFDKKFINIDKNKNKYVKDQMEKLQKTKETWQTRVDAVKINNKQQERETAKKMRDDRNS